MLPPRGEFIGKWAIVKSSQRRPRCSCFGIGQRRVEHNELYIDVDTYKHYWAARKAGLDWRADTHTSWKLYFTGQKRRPFEAQDKQDRRTPY